MSSPAYAVRGDLLVMCRTMSDDQLSAAASAHIRAERLDRAALAAIRYVQNERLTK